MDLNRKEKKFIKKQIKTLSVEEIAKQLGHTDKEIWSYLQKNLTKEKFDKISRTKKLEVDNFTNIFEKTKNFNFWNWFKNNWEFVLILALIIFGVYLNSLGNDFLSDDIATIRDNPELKNLSYIKSEALPYISLTRLSEHINYSLFGLNPVPYHLSNVFLHLGSTVLVFILACIFFNQTIGFFSAIIFAVHPLSSETVSWISAQPYAVGVFFSLLATLFFLKTLASKKWSYVIITFILYLLAFAGSEKTAVLPIVWGLFIIINDNLRRDWKIWKLFTPLGIQFLVWTLVLAGLVGKRITILQTTFYSSGGVENPLHQLPISLSTYLELFVAPINLTFYHSEELLLPPQLFIIKLIITLIFISLMIYFYFKDKRIFFWLIFFPIMLTTTLTPLRISWIVAERYAYLGITGLIITLAYFIYLVGEKSNKKYISWLILIILVSLYSARTIIRTYDWRNQDYLWLATDKVSPNSHQNHNNLGDLYYRRKDYPKAIQEFQKAINLKPNYGDAYHNMANVYHQMNNDDDALTNYKTALTFNPAIWQSNLNIAAIYYNRGDLQNAIDYLEKAAQIAPNNIDIYNNLASLYLKTGNMDKAKQELQKVLIINPNDQKAKQFLDGMGNQ